MYRHGEISKQTKYDANEIIICDGYAEIVLYNKNGIESNRAKVDIDDLPKIYGHRWSLSNRAVKTQEHHTSLHHIILGTCGYTVFINKDYTDCRRNNIIIGDNHKSAQNQKIAINNTSGYKGVSWHKISKKWMSMITVDGERISLGYFHDINKAIAKRKAAEEKYFGDFAYDASRDVTLSKEAIQ